MAHHSEIKLSNFGPSPQPPEIGRDALPLHGSATLGDFQKRIVESVRKQEQEQSQPMSIPLSTMHPSIRIGPEDLWNFPFREVTKWSVPTAISDNLTIDHVLVTLAPAKIAVASQVDWCDRLQMEKVPVSYAVAIVNRSKMYFFSEDSNILENDSKVQRFSELASLLDHAKRIDCYHSMRFYGLLRQPYSLTYDTIRRLPPPLLEKIPKDTFGTFLKIGYIEEDAMIHWRFRTRSIFQQLRDQTSRVVMLKTLFTHNPSWAPSELVEKLPLDIDYAKWYEEKDYKQIRVGLMAELALTSIAYDRAYGSPLPPNALSPAPQGEFISYPINEEMSRRTRLRDPFETTHN